MLALLRKVKTVQNIVMRSFNFTVKSKVGRYTNSLHTYVSKSRLLEI